MCTLEYLGHVTSGANSKICTIEIRFRKMTSTKVKAVCPLFKQRKISRDLKLTNLRSLISASLKSATTAEFEDLEKAINTTSRSDQTMAADT